MIDAPTLTVFLQQFGPVGGLAAILAYAFLKRPPDTKPDLPPLASKEYEAAVGAALTRMAVTLESQTATLQKIEQYLFVLITRPRDHD